MVSQPAVDTNAAKHHVFSFPPKLVGMRLVGLRRRGTEGLGRSLGGARHLEPPAPQQVLEEGLGRLILAWRGRRADGERRAGNLQALRFRGGIDDDRWDAEAILEIGRASCRERA